MMPSAPFVARQSWPPDQEDDWDGLEPDMPWAQPSCTKGRVNKAGDLLRRTNPDDLFYPADWDEMLGFINNWRSIHAFPLQVIKMTLRMRAQKVAKRGRSVAIVAQRLKRLESIWAKMRLTPHMSLTQMQDIGGCRAVMRSVSQVNELVSVYEASIAKNPNRGQEFKERYNYIQGPPGPKDTGYRGIHYVFKYRSDMSKHQCYNSLRIEIQIRSQLQHAWATAVETVSALTKQALKSNIGGDDWKRFFALMSSAIALRERMPIVPGTPSNNRVLYDELKFLAHKLNIEPMLQGYGKVVFQLTGTEKGAKAYLLVMDPVGRTIKVRSFGRDDVIIAESEYLAVEKTLDREKGMQAVLVSADSISSLRRAYPNYFLDTGAFLDALARATAK